MAPRRRLTDDGHGHGAQVCYRLELRMATLLAKMRCDDETRSDWVVRYAREI